MEISTFNNEEFGEIRTIQENGEVLFCGADIAKALGYSNTRDALSRHCKGVVKCDTPTNGGIQSLGFISEGNVYRLIAHSKLPGAERFEKWVFDEVLPSIRKNGAYMTEDVLEQALASPDFLIELATRLKRRKMHSLPFPIRSCSQKQIISICSLTEICSQVFATLQRNSV